MKTALLRKEGERDYWLDLSLGLKWFQNDSTYNQFFLENLVLIEDLPYTNNDAIVSETGNNNSIPLLFKDYKDYTSLVVGLFTALNWTRSLRFYSSYHFVRRNYANIYARYGEQEKTDRLNGAYKADLQRNLAHVFSLSLKWSARNGFFNLQPFLGLQFYDSNNNQDPNLNYDLYFLGLKLNYDI